ncbi:osteoclast stimulatory transmembrane protein [Salminus brasiliensis]|uniref:osteoclast stimulatory transmembrane protein n=1 Tax=Salminus brasiliensis TaxID=930266 RepID=UPI003B82F0A9
MSLWNNRNTFRGLVRNHMESFWFSYSTPTPRSARQVFTLLLLCLAVSMGTAILLFHWLNKLLMYTPQTAGIAAGIHAAAMFISLFLVHPLRCAFTLMFPTLGTRQGRKLVLSMCAMIIVLYVLPNIAANIAAISHLMKCTSENLAHSLLNSAQLSNNIKSNMIERVQLINSNTVFLAETLSNFNHSTEINVSELRERLTNLSKHVEEDFSKAKHQLKEVKLLSSRIFAAFFVFYLFMDSAMYLKSYLTSVRFDNVYISGLLRRTASDKGIQVEAKDVKNGVNSTSFRMTKKELVRCLVPILQITLYLLMTLMLIILDRIVHYLVETGGNWLLDIPPTHITVQVHFKVGYQNIFCYLLGRNTEVRDFGKTYSAIVGSDAAECKAEASHLNPKVLVSLGLLYLVSYSLAFLEVYARRLRRKVASSFFQQQERKRIDYLIEKILKKRENPKSVPSAKGEVEGEEKKMQGSDEMECEDQPQGQLCQFYKLQETSVSLAVSSV